MNVCNELLYKKKDESFEQYRLRCYSLKDALGYTWDEMAEVINQYSDIPHSESWYRKECKRLSVAPVIEETVDSDDTECEDLKAILMEIRKERVKLGDERVQNNAYIRKMSREETLHEIAEKTAMIVGKQKFLPTANKMDVTDAECIGTLLISDWHYGIEFDNYFNVYNPEVCRTRVANLVQDVIKIGKANNYKQLNVVNLSDLIAGRIHLAIRLQSREDVITQVMEVSEIVSEMLCDLSQYFHISYYDVMDNHSRLEPNKKDSLELETLVRIIPWYVKERLKGNKNVEINHNTFADDIAAFNIYDFKVAAVHGHKDKPSKVIDNLNAMTRRRNDLVLSAHYHHISLEEEHEGIRISNGSLMGVDTYSMDMRLTSRPSQTLIISTPDNVIKCLYKINVDR